MDLSRLDSTAAPHERPTSMASRWHAANRSPPWVVRPSSGQAPSGQGVVVVGPYAWTAPGQKPDLATYYYCVRYGQSPQPRLRLRAVLPEAELSDGQGHQPSSANTIMHPDAIVRYKCLRGTWDDVSACSL